MGRRLPATSVFTGRCRRLLWAGALAALLAGTGGAAHAQPAEPPSYQLDQLLALARASHPVLGAAYARVDGAQAAVRSAAALRNPELELSTGRNRARMEGAAPGSTFSVSVTQPIERPALRQARVQAAEAALEGSRAGAGSLALDLLAEVQRRYYAVLRSEAELGNARDDLALANQIRERVVVRVDSGEAPRYELVRADTELLNAQRVLRVAELRVRQVRHELRRQVGPGLPAEFQLAPAADDPLAGGVPPPLEQMQAVLLQRHPELLAARAELRAAQARLGVERQSRLPSFALRAGVDREPDIQGHRVGLVMSVPLLDRRAGPVAEAEAELRRLSHALADRELQLTQQLEAAWQQHQIAAGQVIALDSGILRQAQNAMRIAEAAYRSGERGILEWLDAQRAFRQARNDLDAARYELRAARVELDRLQGLQVADL